MFRVITLHLSSSLLTNVSSCTVTVPVIPVPDSKSKDVLELKEGEAVLAVPVIGLIPNPIKPEERKINSELGKLRRRLTIQPLCHLRPISSLPSCVHCGIPCRLLQSTTVCPTLTEISNMTIVLKERLPLTASRACRVHWELHLKGGPWWRCSWRGPWTRPCPQGVPPWRRRGPQHQPWSLPPSGHQSRRTPQNP